ncbi:Alpha/Beta hydrolase protein [Pelagophyceae sp. CCMP2097]|nr:Alpha/Beta hydrolase protein [Pelagophyceae sp. CCMP2097]|mmetsp:Transcript_30901/g.104069  ORF Transcript_30901/g.104069 Transcript_30901/m.104069 type:complete len:246 (+) Transcript_30901:81-818(+)
MRLCLLAAVFLPRTRAMSTAALKPVVIFVHGSGDNGPGAEGWVSSLAGPKAMQNFRWIFPSATPIPYTLQRGATSSVWFDRKGGFDPEYPEQTASVERSVDRLVTMIDEQVARGVEPAQIAIGGFSMGGAMAYQVAARWHASAERAPLGGVFVLSSYLQEDSAAYGIVSASDSAARWPKTFVAHGGDDDFIKTAWGAATFERMKTLGVDASFAVVPRCQHDMKAGEIASLLEYLQTSLQPSETCQ